MNVSAIQSAPPGSGVLTNILPERQTVNRASAAEHRPAQSAQDTSTTSAVSQSKPEELDQAVKAVNDFVKPFNNALNFSVDQESQTTVVKVIDQSTKEVIRQIPSEEMLALAKALDTMKGLLIQQKA
jgi:flagellar protein FlaG